MIFHGPNTYISPAWYQPQPGNVPTWNYVVVHVKGAAKIVEAPADIFRILQKSIQHFESKNKTNWTLPDEPNSELASFLKAIVAFRIKIKDIQAKFKLSQKQEPTDRNNVIEQLKNLGEFKGSTVAEYMDLVMKMKIEDKTFK